MISAKCTKPALLLVHAKNSTARSLSHFHFVTALQPLRKVFRPRRPSDPYTKYIRTTKICEASRCFSAQLHIASCSHCAKHKHRHLPLPPHTGRPFAFLSAIFMATQDQLVDRLVAEGVVKHKEVESALRVVDRSYFVASTNLPKHYVYQVRGVRRTDDHLGSLFALHNTDLTQLRCFLCQQDSPLPIGYGETISAPHM